MAFDGITVSALKNELKGKLTGGRVYKIAQPESDTLLLTIKNPDTQRLIISANASFPLIYLTDENRPSPKTAPGFCMLLRKYLQNGRISDITQPGIERIIKLEIEHMDEMGDLRPVYLIAEFMGKHSNIILTDENDNILDAIKRIPASVSSVREVLPGRTYFVPNTEDKADPLTLSENDFHQKIFKVAGNLQKALYSSLTGISPLIALEICERAGMEPDRPATSLSLDERNRIFTSFTELIANVKSSDYFCAVYNDFQKPEFSVIRLNRHAAFTPYNTPSEMLTAFYSAKEKDNRIKQKSADLRKLTSVFLERAYKKLGIQENDIEKTKGMDKYKKYGELLQAFGYGIEPGLKSVTVPDYYDNDKDIDIPLKPDLTPQENANAYFKRYNKLKRTFEAASLQLEDTKSEIAQLEGISLALDIAENEDDLLRIKQELTSAGYLHSKTNSSKKQVSSPPMHFISSDGFDIYVGKNNYQNDEITFKMSSPSDWWFHAKDIAGSHVLLKSGGKEVPDRSFEEAGALAAFYSKGGKGDKVEIDYVQKKEVKKPSGAKPGFVVYYTNFSLMASTDISAIKKVE